jgi:hypothetical protein
MLSHRIRPVSEILAPYVEHLWVVRCYLPARWRNIILPDGAMELIVNLGDPQKLCARDNPAPPAEFKKISYARVRVESRSKDGKFDRIETAYAAGMGLVWSGLIA